MKLININEVSWITLYQPGQKEIDRLVQLYQLPAGIFKDLLKPAARPKLVSYGPFLLLIFQFPIYNPQKKKVTRAEVDFLLGKNFLITAHWQPMPPLQEFQELLVNREKRQAYPVEKPYQLLFYLLSNFYQFLQRELDHIHHDIEWLEDNLFAKIGRQMIKTTSTIRNNIISFEHYLLNHDEMLARLDHHFKQQNNLEAEKYFKTLLAQVKAIQATITLYDQLTAALHETQDTLLNVKINEIVLFLTVITTLAIPFGLITLLPEGAVKDLGLILAFLIDIFFILLVYRKRWL